MKRIILTALLGGATALAQMGPPPPGGGPRGEFRGGLLGPGGPGMHPWKVVTDAPYSAAMTEQSVETLPNNAGTITHSTTGTVARDKSGRTYVQQTFTGGPFGSQNGQKTLIFITDPVAGYSYTLDPSKMVAIQRPFKTPPAGAGNSGTHSHPKDPNVSVSTTTGGTYQNLTNIETRTMTRTVPANTMGNSATLTSTSTVLYSPDLQIVVSSTRNDPRFGQQTYALTNIVLGDPTNVSFSVPAGYTIQTESGRGRHGFGGPPQ